MTQEELDALMAGELDEDALSDDADSVDEEFEEESDDLDQDSKEDAYKSYKIDANSAWPPPPPTEDHKMVHQLDDVTKDSEIKATQIFDKLETISQFVMDVEESCNGFKETIESNIELFEKLIDKFPHIETFKSALQTNQDCLENIDTSIENLQMSSDEVMMIMDIMQYQDIHRQKIERVINVMRALSKYMSTLFESSVDDTKRVSSAVHIEGDATTEDVVSNEDIEALIASLGKK